MEHPHVLRARGFARHVLNPTMNWLVRRGLTLRGAQLLGVRGRRTGVWRHATVYPLEFAGQTYLVAPRGHVQWTHNLRASGTGTLRSGRRTRHFTAVEVDDPAKPPLLAAYLNRWRPEVGGYFAAVGASPATKEDEWHRLARHFPVFHLTHRRTPTD